MPYVSGLQTGVLLPQEIRKNTLKGTVKRITGYVNLEKKIYIYIIFI
jgi:hypothetical protein